MIDLIARLIFTSSALFLATVSSAAIGSGVEYNVSIIPPVIKTCYHAKHFYLTYFGSMSPDGAGTDFSYEHRTKHGKTRGSAHCFHLLI